MSKLVFRFKHKKPVGIGIPDRGVVYPKGSMKYKGTFNGRDVTGFEYDYDAVHTTDLAPEEAEPMPPTMKDVDSEFVKAYRISQAQEVAGNIKTNEKIIAALRSHEDAGNIECLGRAYVDEKGKVVSEDRKPENKVQPKTEVKPASTPKPAEPPAETAPVEVVEVPKPKAK